MLRCIPRYYLTKRQITPRLRLSGCSTRQTSPGTRDERKLVLYLVLIIGSWLTPLHPHWRPHSMPLISGDSFRSIANHIYDETTEHFDCARVQRGDTIFINLSHIEQFFTNIHPHLTQPYILISHNHDYSAPGTFKHMLDDPKLFAWFTQNADLADHPKVMHIPIGLSNKHWRHSAEHDAYVLQAQKTIPPLYAKKYLFYVNFVVATAPSVRQPVYDYFIKIPFCSWVAHRPYPEFLQDLIQSYFVLSPHGNGLDCHRTWEALYMGSIPVVKTSTLDPLYHNLPVLIVQNWDEITPEFLEKKYHEMTVQNYAYEKLYFPYWLHKIEQKQAECRAQGKQ